MSVLIADPVQGVWEVSQKDHVPRRLPIELEWPCTPCVSAACMAVCCQQQRECLCFGRRDHTLISRMPAPPGVCQLALSSGYAYQLSSEADCIHTRCIASGELLFAAPVGVFPRSMQLDAQGRYLLAAGGAAPEAYILDAPELTCARTIHTRHPCFAADFWQNGLVLVCAVEGEDIQTAVYTLKNRGVRPRKLLVLPGQPGGLCVCGDGMHALVSTREGCFKLELTTGELLWNRPEWALGMRLSCRGDSALVSDLPDGRAYLFNHQRPWEQWLLLGGMGAQACFA